MTFDQIIASLHALANEEKVIFKEKKFGVTANNTLGIYQADLNELVKKIGKNSPLAMQLFDSGIYEARILCGKLFQAKDLTEDLMEHWVATFENWEICDTFCMALFAKSRFAIPKAIEWTSREREFEKRAGYATIAAYCMADKKAPNETYTQFFPIIERAALDDRIYVKKAVNWALRSIGKRNRDLNRQAIEVAEVLLRLDDKTARWIAQDALKELTGENVKILDYPRSVYRQ